MFTKLTSTLKEEAPYNEADRVFIYTFTKLTRTRKEAPYNEAG